jgi:hypothetical protein
MQVLPHGLPVLHTGVLGGVTWQTLPLAIQVFPHGTPVLQLGAAPAAEAKARAAMAAMTKLRMFSSVGGGNLCHGVSAWLAPASTMAMRKAGLALLTVFFSLVPNGPHVAWYAIPEVVCGWFESDEDQWRCDMEPVAWQRREVQSRRH